MSEPLTPEQLKEILDDPMKRLCTLYKIIIKGDDPDDEGLVMQFKPNRAQRRLLSRMWHRNLILKARQLGFTTLVAILWLDTALFSKNPIRCGIIAQDKGAAESFFRDKVKFAYDNLMPELRERMPLATENTSELVFAHNGASIRVATSMRSGTLHRLHVSEFGKICAEHPKKAHEVVTGSIPSVPKSGILIIESTAEGQDGEFYKITKRAQELSEKGTTLNEKDYRFHFFPWWEAPEYELEPEAVIFTEVHNKYFHEVEGKIKRKLPDRKRAWYVATLESDFSGDATKMWQEYPSFPDEAFQVSTQGCYYATQLATAREKGRVVEEIPFVKGVPVNTFWDIGRGDMTTIWFHQSVAMQNRFIKYYEASGEELDHYTGYLQGTGWTFGTHFLPHEADHKRIGKSADTNQTIKEMLEELLPGATFEVVPVVSNINAGIQATRAAFSSSYFCETGCGQGLKRLGNYKKTWDKTRGCWTNTPVHDDNSHGADAYRQFGQVLEAGATFATAVVARPSGTKAFVRRGSGMAR